MTTPEVPTPIGKTKGYKSTEFWAAQILTLLAVVVEMGVIPLTSGWLGPVLAIAAAVAQTAYIGSRAGLKKSLLRAIEATEKARAVQIAKSEVPAPKDQEDPPVATP